MLTCPILLSKRDGSAALVNARLMESAGDKLIHVRLCKPMIGY